MQLRLEQGYPHGQVSAPPSKSYGHRALLAAFLGHGQVKGLSFSNDIKATLACIKALGGVYTQEGDSVSFASKYQQAKSNELYAGESGSTLRFIIPLAMYLCGDFRIECTEKLLSRGVEAYQALFPEFTFEIEGNFLHVFGDKTKICAGEFALDVSKSSQYVTGLLFLLPLLDGESKIRFIGELQSAPYVYMTMDALEEYGVHASMCDTGISIKGNQTYQPNCLSVEADESNAAFLNAFSYLGGEVEIDNLNPDTKQGDAVHQSYFRLMEEGYCELDLGNCIDLAPVCFVFASLFHGARFVHTSRLAIKESNRALAMQEELAKANVDVEVKEDEVIVHPMKEIPSHFSFSCHNDHRIAMACSLFASKGDVTLDGYECVSKSFPDYFEVLERLGMKVTYGN